MTAQNQLLIDLVLNDKEALSRLRTSLQSVESQSKKTAEGMNAGFIAAGAAAAGAALAVAKLVDIAKDAINAAAEQEEASQRLNTALRLQGITIREIGERYEEMASRLQKATRFSDEAILAVQQRLVTIGNVAPAHMERVTQATLDLATALKVDLEQASTIVAKAMIGETAALTRQIPAYEEFIKKGATASQILEKLSTDFGGSAQDAVKTYAGAHDRLKNALGEVLGEFGNMLIKSPLVEGSLNKMADSAHKVAESMRRIRENTPDKLWSEASASEINATLRARETMMGRSGNSAEENFRDSLGVSAGQQAEAARRGAEALAEVRAQIEAEELMHKQRLIEIERTFQNERLQEILMHTDTGKLLKQQETEAFIAETNRKIQADLQYANLDAATKQRLLLHQKALAEAEKVMEAAKQNAKLKSLAAQFKTEMEMAQATADLVSAVASLSGKSSLKAVAIVMQAVVTAVNIMMTAVNPMLAILKIATTAVSAAVAIQQLNQAEKALEAARSERITPVTNVPGFAGGVTNFSGGLAIVGEQGPELVNLPKGSNVIPNNKLPTGDIHISINMSGNIMASPEAAQEFAREISSYVSEFIEAERARL